jgi:hypothetical protein
MGSTVDAGGDSDVPSEYFYFHIVESRVRARNLPHDSARREDVPWVSKHCASRVCRDDEMEPARSWLFWRHGLLGIWMLLASTVPYASKVWRLCE